MSESSPITEQANPETKLARDRCSPEDLPHDALQTIPRTEPVVQVLEQINAELENLPVGAGRTQVEEEEDVVNDSGRLVQPDAGGSSSGGLKRIPSITRGFPFPVSYLKPVGKAFEDNRNVIWSWLMDDEISTIGIYGIGGIGKTTMLQHIHDELLRRPDISHHVYWVTLSRNFSIHKLQNLIAKHLDLDLSREYDIPLRAVKLFKELMKKQEWILILDDVWESFELRTVGIPVPLKGCKVIFTTRSNAICQRMGSQVITKVRPLSEREAWTLFMEKLGHGIALSPEVERIAADIARECAGLPLGIITMAGSLRGSLRGVDDKYGWRNTLKKLKESKSRDKEDEVFRILRFSYDRLDDCTLQQCLVYCTLLHEDYITKREELVDYLIDRGIIQKKWIGGAAFNKCHAMLDKLENAGFLQRIDGGRGVKMHDLVRDMVVRICKEYPYVMEQRRKGIEMFGSNIDPFAIDNVQQMNDGRLKCKFCGNRFAKGTSLSRIRCHFSEERAIGRRVLHEEVPLSMLGGGMRQRRKTIEMAPLKSVWTGAVSASEQEVDVAQQQEPLLTGEANDLTGGGIELQHDASDELKKLKGSKYRDMVDFLKSGWTLLLTNLILEMASAVFDQLGNALVGMVLAFVALLLSTAELIYMERMSTIVEYFGWVGAVRQCFYSTVEYAYARQKKDNPINRARRERMSLLPIFHRPSTATLAPGKPVGTIVEYFGLVGAVWQCFYSTVEYAYARQKKDNPIKMCLLPFIFLLCVVISKLIKKSHIDKSA